jgi:hypothetical protein
MPGRVIPMRRRTSKAALFSALILAAAGYSSSKTLPPRPSSCLTGTGRLISAASNSRKRSTPRLPNLRR